MSVTPVSSTNSTITVLSSSAPATKIAKQATETVKANSLSATDTYISSSNLLDGTVVALFGSYQNTTAAMDRDMNSAVVTDYLNVGGSVKRAAINRSITSAIRNGIQVARGKETWAGAGGNVVGDVSTSAVSSGVSALATNAAVFGLSKLGASSFPVLAGGMIAGFVADKVATKVMVKTGAQAAIINKTTELLEKIGVPNSEPTKN